MIAAVRWREHLEALGLSEGPDSCFGIQFEWGWLQLWDWDSGPEWFLCGNSLGDNGPRTVDELKTLLHILGDRN
jgi:hypothetical protein